MDQLTSGLGVDIKEESFTLQHLKEWRDSQDMEKRRETLRKTLHDMKLSGSFFVFIFQSQKLSKVLFNLQ